MTDKNIGLIGKYHIERLTDDKPVVWAFVLEDTDPLAAPVLKTYADLAEGRGYHKLAADLRRVIPKLPRTRQDWEGPGTANDFDEALVALVRLFDAHKERAAGRLFNGPQGACSACMQQYPCTVVKALEPIWQILMGHAVEATKET